MKIYNTLSKKKEVFEPLNPGKVGMYTCGPTVYGDVHVGNIRAYVVADTLRRYLQYLGYEVRHIKNITDVGHLTADDVAQGDSGEDKIEKKARAEKKTPEEIARFYEQRFREVEKEMNILPANYFPRATAHVGQMIRAIETLLSKGYAYEKNGNVFFDVTKFPAYGKLSGNTLEKLKVGARLEEHPDKKNPWDFALWLSAPKEHLMKWDSPWGVGYPGWHIECTAMSTEYLGSTIDIHTGGEDNIFPHHEAEIAQTECATGEQFVRYWLHVRHLLMDGEKMSKSKGNLFTLEDLIKKGYSPMAVRLLLLSSHHRSQLNFTWDALEQAKKNLQRINDFALNLEAFKGEVKKENPNPLAIDSFRQRFEAAMDDDLNTPLALSIIYELISAANRAADAGTLGADDAAHLLSFWKKANSILGLALSGQAEIPEEIKKLAAEREQARAKKDFAASDRLRTLIESRGYTVEDSRDGMKIFKH
ncbi:MAG TPA: cysteine--tRNA ligase [Candidatus Moranbacteria bacterium]|nr:cysteine--tRNA ligase [Candidatus Moranbacteria bacterium]